MKILKYILSITILVTFSIGGYQIGDSFANSQVGAASNSSNAVTSKQSYNYPQTLNISKLGVYANVELVGIAADGSMDIPNNENNAGWWKFGASPGEKGSVVIAGHIDRSTGGPGIFYELNSLEIGDIVEVVDNNSKVFKYKVVRKVTYEDDLFPVDRVFKSNAKSLNLITCEGSYDRTEENYNQRLVVYTELVENRLFSFR